MAIQLRRVIQRAARTLEVCDPLPLIGSLIDRTFFRPEGDPAYSNSLLSPGFVPLEPSFSEAEPGILRFVIEPLGPAPARREEATRELRRLVGLQFGRYALDWIDTRTEVWRTRDDQEELRYGAWLGYGFDANGLQVAKIYYEMSPGQIDALPAGLARLGRQAMTAMPALNPAFTTIGRKRTGGSQRVTFAYRGQLSVQALGKVMESLGIGDRFPDLCATVACVLPEETEFENGGTMLGLREIDGGVELKLEIMLKALSSMPPGFMASLRRKLEGAPCTLAAFNRWLSAFEMDDTLVASRASVLSIRVAPEGPARISLYFCPIPATGPV